MCRDANGQRLELEARDKRWLAGIGVTIALFIIGAVMIPWGLGWLHHDRLLQGIQKDVTFLGKTVNGINVELDDAEKVSRANRDAIIRLGGDPD